MPSFPLPDPDLRDDALRLRPPRDADVPALIEACNDPDVRRFTFVPEPYEEQHAVEWVTGAPDRREAGTQLNLVIAEPGDGGALLGTAGLLRPDWDRSIVEVGYFVAPWARGRGLAARAAWLCAVWALRELRMARVIVQIEPANVASLRAAQRAGFVREGVLRSGGVIKGRRCDLVVCSLLPADLRDAA